LIRSDGRERQVQEHLVGEQGDVVLTPHEVVHVVVVVAGAPDDAEAQTLAVESLEVLVLLVGERLEREQEDRLAAIGDGLGRRHLPDERLPRGRRGNHEQGASVQHPALVDRRELQVIEPALDEVEDHGRLLPPEAPGLGPRAFGYLIAHRARVETIGTLPEGAQQGPREQPVAFEFVGLLVVLGGRDDDPSVPSKSSDRGHAAAGGGYALEDARRGAPAEAAVEDHDDGTGV